ncbi:hypothetical protein RUM44_013120 [Polyplax serrata]|uniref:CHK kinase-like domain-containing protein n=1 Tax=Polyplax serrata TaxID=468196 RepID=A0ABR1BH79_POLSC
MILPMCLKYLKENSWEDVNNEFCFPRYYGQCQMFLVVQDLATEGYQVVNRVKGFSKKECSVILQELSRFHAVSFALKKREKQLFSDMKDRLIETVFREEYREGLLGVIWENSLKFAARSLNESNCPKLRKVSEKLQSYSGRVLSTLIDLSNSKCSKFNVICHGDLWNNNILLRYCDSGYPIGVKFIDLQAMRFSSCVLDVMHVIFTSSRPVVHERHLDVLLAEYFESLGSHLGNFGETLDFTFDEYKGEFESKVLFGVFVASLMFTCITRTSTATETADVVFDKEKLSSQTEVDKIYNSLNSAYHERIRSLFLTLTNLNLI